jgi:2-polyprenyl-3-methyl-5-hydroxy-6-metoxy-1,4-benzoquinol methylase
MQTDVKRALAETDSDKIQAGNRQWWTDHTMSYDWRNRVGEARFTAPWFDEIDRRFAHGARLFAHQHQPFDRIIPFDRLHGRSVLEIGCGMGLHSELMARAGAKLTSVDISDTSVEATRRRFDLRGLDADIRRMDARQLAFPDASFDFVWSWGVIHHSADTAAIIREVARVLRQDGETRIMVYNLNGTAAYATIVRDYLSGFWRGRSLDEVLWARSDGFMARFYSQDILTDIMRLFFSRVTAQTFGQEADAVPLPARLRRLIIPLMSHESLVRRANQAGAFLFMTATK